MWSSIFKGELGLRDIFLAISFLAIAIHFGFNNVFFSLGIGVMVFLSERLYRDGVSVSRGLEALKYALICAGIVGLLAWLSNQSFSAFINARESLFTKTFSGLPFALATYGFIELVAAFLLGDTSLDDEP